MMWGRGDLEGPRLEANEGIVSGNGGCGQILIYRLLGVLQHFEQT